MLNWLAICLVQKQSLLDLLLGFNFKKNIKD